MPGLQRNIYASVSITWCAAIVALLLRLAARRMMKMMPWFDDYLACTALFFASAYCSVTIYWTVHYKLGQSIASIEDQDRANHIRKTSGILLWVCELCYASSIASAKLAVLSFYWRIFRYTSIRIPILILVAAVVVWIMVKIFLVIFTCVPVQAYWDPSTKGAHCPINAPIASFSTSLTHSIMDCIILILPVVEVIKMHIPLSQKLATIGLFTSGTIVCLASIFGIVLSIKYNPQTPEMPLDIAPGMFWAAVEINLAIFAACLPMLRPIFRRAVSWLSSIRTNHATHLESGSPSRTLSSGGRFKHQDSGQTRVTNELGNILSGDLEDSCQRGQPATT